MNLNSENNNVNMFGCLQLMLVIISLFAFDELKPYAFRFSVLMIFGIFDELKPCFNVFAPYYIFFIK